MTRRGPHYRDITIGLTPAQYAYLRAEAEARTTSIGQLVREILAEYLPPLLDVPATPRQRKRNSPPRV
jgi:hypothetical protein